jgi:hypothetical protein
MPNELPCRMCDGIKCPFCDDTGLESARLARSDRIYNTFKVDLAKGGEWPVYGGGWQVMLRLDYYITTNINLSTEDFQNAGYTPEQIKKVIESFRDEYGSYLHCEPSGINNNWCFRVSSSDTYYHQGLVASIHSALLRTKPESATA